MGNDDREREDPDTSKPDHPGKGDERDPRTAPIDPAREPGSNPPPTDPGIIHTPGRSESPGTGDKDKSKD